MKVIITHQNPDFDAIASAIAAKKLYPDATVVFSGLPKRVQKSPIIHSLIKSGSVEDVDMSLVDTLIVVDTHSSRRIGEFSNILGKVKTICFDHHDEGEICCDEFYQARTGSNTTQIVLEIMERKIDISPEEATLFMLGIYEDTGKLQYNTTTPDDFRACAYLVERGADLGVVSDVLDRVFNETEISLLNDLLRNKRVYEVGGRSIILSFASHEGYVGDAAVIVNRLLSITKASAALCLFRMGARIYVIGRSKDDSVDIGGIVRRLGGGGHPSAASAVLKGVTLIEAVENASSVLQEEILNNIKASEIMSYPPKYVGPNDTVEDANKMMAKFAINSLVVVDNEEVVGIITRQIVQRALFHNLGGECVGRFMESEFELLRDDEGFVRVRDIILSKRQRIIPVVSHVDSRLVGVITRTNLLKLMSGIGGYEEMKKRLSVSDKLKRRLPEGIYRHLRRAGEVAGELGFKAYLVGGMVRDIMLGIDNLDVDIVIEGDGIKFAKEYSKRYGGRVVQHKEFRTATLVSDDGFKMDVATAREEYYEIPGVLPHVETSSIKLDLYRRDFTINTLAIKLVDSFGDLLDFFGGLEDIKRGKIRVLHSLSFVEDPTRIFRAIRFAARFDFEIGKQTERLMRTALDLGFLKNVSRGRIFHEIRLILSSGKVKEAFELFNRYGVLRNLNEALRIDGTILEFLDRIDDALKACDIFCGGIGVKREEVYFTVLQYLYRGKVDFLGVVGADDGLRKKVLRNIGRIDGALRTVSREGVSNAEVYYALHRLSIEGVLAVFVIAEDNRKVALYLDRLMKMKPLITGRDLMSMGFEQSPILSRIKEDVFKKQLDGEIRDKVQALEYVKERYLTD